MRNIHFGSGDITTLILIRKDAIIESDINKHYVTPLENRGLDRENIAVYGLLYEDSKIKAELGKNYLRMLLSKINKMNTIQNLIVADTSYFKWLIKKSKITFNAILEFFFTINSTSLILNIKFLTPSVFQFLI